MRTHKHLARRISNYIKRRVEVSMKYGVMRAREALALLLDS